MEQGNNHYSIYIIYDKEQQKVTLHLIQVDQEVSVLTDLIKRLWNWQNKMQGSRLTMHRNCTHSR